MSQRYIAERLREHHENRDTPHACQKAILAYEEERHEAADEIQRLRGPRKCVGKRLFPMGEDNRA
jgi:hypothetical protein